MTPRNLSRPDLPWLLARLAENALTPEEFEQLEQLLETDADARAVYRHHMSVHAMLYWRLHNRDAGSLAANGEIGALNSESAPPLLDSGDFPPSSSSEQVARPSRIPFIYRLFFLFIEPVSALVGAYYAHLDQRTYLDLTDASSSPEGAIPRGTTIVLSQLANLYLFFALNEALVLRQTGELRVWRTVLALLLLADFGHLWTVRPLGWAVYWNAPGWNAIDWGNVPFVYLGASMRIAFLSGVGLGEPARPVQGKRTT